jgi:signal transduction histidine kinase
VRLDAPPPPPDAPPGDAALEAAYRAALDGRSFTLTRPAPVGDLRRLFRRIQHERDLAIRLADNHLLTLQMRAPVALTPMGLPFGLAGGLLAALVALGALLVMLRETRPLRELAEALDKVDLDGATPPLPSSRRSAPEIRSLIGAFERLQGRLAVLLRTRMALIGGISHDVRTFATRLRLRVEAIENPQERALAVADIADMIRLLDDSLLAAQAGAGFLREELLDLGELAAAEIEGRQRIGAPVALANPLPPGGAPVLGDPLALRRILGNLIDNAIKYGGRAEVSLALADEAVTLCVEDRGPGVPPEARKLVMEPFLRLESSRSREFGGAGLGLAIARNLAQAHGGDIAIDDRPGGGARVSLCLPLFSA